MANNCLVTKLKGTVQNDNLPILGALKFEVNPNGDVAYNEGNCIHIINSKAMTVQSNENLLGPSQDNWGTSRDFAANANNAYIHTIKRGQKVYFGEKYSITTLEIRNVNTTLDLTELNYMQYLASFFISAINTTVHFIGSYDVAPLKDLAALPFTHGVNNINQFTGATLFIGETLTAEDVALIPANVKNITLITDTFNINVITALQSMESLSLNTRRNVSGNFELLGNIAPFKSYRGGSLGTISGTIEGFVANKRATGVTEDSEGVSLIWANSGNGITFNGTPIANEGTERKITWTETTITYNGVTIDA